MVVAAISNLEYRSGRRREIPDGELLDLVRGYFEKGGQSVVTPRGNVLLVFPGDTARGLGSWLSGVEAEAASRSSRENSNQTNLVDAEDSSETEADHRLNRLGVVAAGVLGILGNLVDQKTWRPEARIALNVALGLVRTGLFFVNPAAGFVWTGFSMAKNYSERMVRGFDPDMNFFQFMTEPLTQDLRFVAETAKLVLEKNKSAERARKAIWRVLGLAGAGVVGLASWSMTASGLGGLERALAGGFQLAAVGGLMESVKGTLGSLNDEQRENLGEALRVMGFVTGSVALLGMSQLGRVMGDLTGEGGHLPSTAAHQVAQPGLVEQIQAGFGKLIGGGQQLVESGLRDDFVTAGHSGNYLTGEYQAQDGVHVVMIVKGGDGSVAVWGPAGYEGIHNSLNEFIEAHPGTVGAYNIFDGETHRFAHSVSQDAVVTDEPAPSDQAAVQAPVFPEIDQQGHVEGLTYMHTNGTEADLVFAPRGGWFGMLQRDAYFRHLNPVGVSEWSGNQIGDAAGQAFQVLRGEFSANGIEMHGVTGHDTTSLETLILDYVNQARTDLTEMERVNLAVAIYTKVAAYL
jgi:hypothetical protein